MVLNPEPLENFCNHHGANGNTEIARGLPIYYDSPRTAFWLQNDRGGWIMVKSPDIRRFLAEQGFRKNVLKEENVSQIDSLLTAIQQSHDVDYADSLAGHCVGVHMISGKRILVRDSPKLIQPAPGTFDLLEGILLRMLGSEQLQYLLGWLKVAIEALYSRQLRSGQALTLAGEKDSGKSLIQNLFTDLFGGRSIKPHRYMSGLTPFNGELFGSEHLIIEDEEASTDIRARRNFGTKIKEICANLTQSCHPKNRQALSLPPFWRLSISVNDELENLMILPPIDESLQDKIIILKAFKHPMPMPTVTDEERQKFMDALHAELPAFINFLMQWKIPAELVSQRYGITHFHHPDIMQAIGSLTPESRLLELIDEMLFDSPAPGSWEGTAVELERQFTADGSKVKREAGKLFSFPNACGTYLGRLQKRYPHRFEMDHTRKGNRWTISPSEM